MQDCIGIILQKLHLFEETLLFCRFSLKLALAVSLVSLAKLECYYQKSKIFKNFYKGFRKTPRFFQIFQDRH